MDDGWLFYQRRAALRLLLQSLQSSPMVFGKIDSRYQSAKSRHSLVWRIGTALCGTGRVLPRKQTGGAGTRPPVNRTQTDPGNHAPKNPLTGERILTGTGMKRFTGGIGIDFCEGRWSEAPFGAFAGTTVHPHRSRGKGNDTKPLDRGAPYMDGAADHQLYGNGDGEYSVQTDLRNFPETVMTLCPTKKTALWNIYCRMLTIRCIMMSCISCDWDMFWTKHEDAV